jgi:hypothetical protein
MSMSESALLTLNFIENNANLISNFTNILVRMPSNHKCSQTAPSGQQHWGHDGTGTEGRNGLHLHCIKEKYKIGKIHGPIHWQKTENENTPFNACTGTFKVGVVYGTPLPVSTGFWSRAKFRFPVSIFLNSFSNLAGLFSFPMSNSLSD